MDCVEDRKSQDTASQPADNLYHSSKQQETCKSTEGVGGDIDGWNQLYDDNLT